MLNSKRYNPGFSLLEIIMVIAILALVFGIALYSFSALRESSDLNNSVRGVEDALRQARAKTLASEGNLSYSVHFETDKYVIFSGTSYSSSASDNEVFDLPSSIEITNISVNGGGSDILFSKISGDANGGSLDARVVSDPGKLRTINIDLSGGVYVIESGVLNPTGTRASDDRHLHFDLGWSIQGASTLTFTFSDPPSSDSVENVTMSSYFNGGQTVFSYKGTFTAFGESQTLKVHTHFLDPSDTTLSIHRDEMDNTKAVSISIDGKEIVSYDSSGAATVGAFGGTMSAQ